MGDLITETDPTGGGTTTYAYDLAGRLTSLTDPDNDITTWTYTHSNEVATEVNPLGFATTYVYLCSGQPQLADFFQISGRRVAPSVGHSRLKAA